MRAGVRAAGLEESAYRDSQISGLSLRTKMTSPAVMTRLHISRFLGTLRDCFYGIPHTRSMHRRNLFNPQAIDLLEGDLI